MVGGVPEYPFLSFSKANGKLDLDKVRELQLTQKQDQRAVVGAGGVLRTSKRAWKFVRGGLGV